jgi:4-amino-4-deoxy-L-arabinose transferase-like glycosyltransferase
LAFRVAFLDPAVPSHQRSWFSAAIEQARHSHRVSVAAFLVIATVSIFPGLDRATLWEPDEPRFAEATRQMFERGDFITPYLNSVPRFEKPPLLYWLQSLTALPLGTTELSARLPSAMAGVGCVWLLYLLAAHLTSRRAALISAIVLATMFRFVVFARQGLTDVPTMFFVVAALFGFVRATEGTPRPRAVWLAWTALGLGVLTKGPVGLLPLAIWAVYAAVRREMRLISGVRPVAGLALTILIAAPWYVAMFLIHGRAFTDFAIGHEMVSRVLSEASFAPARGFFYYWQVWPGDAAPWSVIFVAALMWSGYDWRSLDRTVRRPIVFALVWFVSVLVIFSLSQSKIPHYVLPAYPAAALLIGVFIDRVADRTAEAIWWRVPIALVAVTCVAAAAVLLRSMVVLMPDSSAAERLLVPLVLGCGGLALAAAVWRASAVRAAWSLAILLSIVFALIGSVIVPGAIERFKPMPHLAREAAVLAGPDEPIGLLGRYGASSLIYYGHRNIRWLLDDDAAVAFFSSGPRAVCVMPASDYARLAPRLPPSIRVVASGEEFNVRLSRLIERQSTPGRQWVLLAVDASRSGRP